MANSLVSLDDIAFSALDFLFRKATLLTSVWRDVTAPEFAKNRGETVGVRAPLFFLSTAGMAPIRRRPELGPA